MLFSRKRKPEPRPINAPAEIAGIRVRASTRARRLALRIDSRSGDIVLTWPRGASEKSALRFINDSQDWIQRQHAKGKPDNVFVPGGEFAVLGRDYAVEHRPGRGLTRFEEDKLIVHGQPEHIARRIRDFLKAEAETVLQELSNKKSAQLQLKPSPVRIVDPKTRWGSCGPDGKLMYSWRLILAPPLVLDYVVAHEVAHRIHMNHGKKFWALCMSLTEGGMQSRRWLKTHGHALMLLR